MLKDYPATQLFLLSSILLMALFFLTPLVKEWYVCAAILNSLKFVVKVICGFLFICTVIDIVDAMHLRKQKHSR